MILCSSSASIFKRMSETPGAQNSVTDYTGSYKVGVEQRGGGFRLISFVFPEICRY